MTEPLRFGFHIDCLQHSLFRLNPTNIIEFLLGQGRQNGSLLSDPSFSPQKFVAVIPGRRLGCPFSEL